MNIVLHGESTTDTNDNGNPAIERIKSTAQAIHVTSGGAGGTANTDITSFPFTLATHTGFRNGSAATTEGHIDYIRYVLER